MAMQKALIVQGGWEGHEPLACARRVEAFLKADGLAVDVREGSAAFDDPTLADFDLIVPIITMASIDEAALTRLCDTVAAGTGLAGFHGGMGDAFRNAPAYQFMVGGQWVAHPGDIIDYSVTITRPDDPVMQGITDFAYRSEQYYMHVDPSNEVLAETCFSGEHCAWIAGVRMPVVWKRRHGQGRVFFSSLGHVAEELDREPMQTILRRGLRWAVRE